jgi:hypothetical protein
MILKLIEQNKSVFKRASVLRMPFDLSTNIVFLCSFSSQFTTILKNTFDALIISCIKETKIHTYICFYTYFYKYTFLGFKIVSIIYILDSILHVLLVILQAAIMLLLFSTLNTFIWGDRVFNVAAI